ncbi:MAG: SDR family NAD(P)-dependent oxidoreductase [Nitrospiraceae bacterium]
MPATHDTRSPSARRGTLNDRLAGTVIMVTGAGRGIGRATAELFAHEGARVALCSRTRKEVQAVCATIKTGRGEVLGAAVDIGSARDVRAFVRRAVRHFGRLDVLINNAGILGPRVPLTRFPDRDWQQVLKINLSGTFYVTREVARVMSDQRSGCIITVSSSVGRVGRAGWGAYAVSKFGAEGLTQVLADELQSSGVRAMTFNPGGTRTAMRAEAYPHEDRSRLHAPSVIAEALVRLITSSSKKHSGGAFDLETLP